MALEKASGVYSEQIESIETNVGVDDGLDEYTRSIVQSYDKKKFEKLRWKVDLHLIPACAMLYLLCFLDRGNIGNAKIAGMTEDLNMTSMQYSVVLVVFFATYCTVEAPTNVLLKIMSPKIFLPLIAILWGVCVLGMGFVKSYHQMIALRVLLGLFEAGLMPGCAYYLSNWYRPMEVSYRIALYFSSATIAGAFSGILAWAIMKMDGVGGLAGWSWIFILEGLLTMVVAVSCYFILHNSPDSCSFLNEEEKVFWKWHLSQDHVKGHKVDDKVEWKHFKEGMFHWKIWYMVILSFGCTVPIYSFSYFLPTIVKTLGWTASTAQLMSAPPYIWACLCTLVCSYLSDKFKNRWIFITVPLAIFATVGFIMTLAQDDAKVSYAGVFLACAGQYAPWPSVISWNANNYPNEHTRGIAVGVQIGFASVGGIVASFIYRPQDSPRYFIGNGVSLGCTVLTIFLTLGLVVYMKRENTKKDEYVRQHPEVYEYSSDELAAMGTKNPLFRYIY